MMKYLMAAAVAVVSMSGVASAAPDVAPSLTGPGWTTDRYEPHSWGQIGPFGGRSDVLGIEINNAEAFNNRAPAFQSTFYNTQGRQHDVVGGVGTLIAADLYISSAWRDPNNGHRRTDMWGIMTDGVSVTDYPIIGFTNYGGAPRLRVWDDETPNGWVDLANTVNYDSWTAFEIELTATSYIYRIDGVVAYTDLTIGATNAFDGMIMQAYNFGGDPAIPDAIAGDPKGNYIAPWSNHLEVPEPATMSVLALGLAGIAFARRRRLT